MTKKTNKKGGSIFINETYTPQEAFNKFLNDSNIHLFSSGGSGVILKATYFGAPETSPYYSFNADNIASPTTELILKLIILNNNISRQNKSIGNLEWEFGRSFLAYSSYTDFQKEINMQNKVVADTIEYLEPLSPTIVYSDIYDGYKETTTLLTILKNRSTQHLRTQELIKTMFKEVNTEQVFKNRTTNEYIQSKSSIGLIAMELISSNFQMLRNVFLGIFSNKFLKDELVKSYEKKIAGIPVNELYNNTDMRMLIDRVYTISTDEKLELYKNMARLSIIEIAEKSGISQGDFHFGNILVDPNYKGYYDDTLIKTEPSPKNSIPSNDSISSLSTLDLNEEDESDTTNIKRPFSKTDFIDDDAIQNKKNYNYDVEDDFDIGITEPDDKQTGGSDDLTNKGKTILIDYGYAAYIPQEDMTTIKTLYYDIYENIDNINERDKLDKMTNAIFDLLNKIYSVKRADTISLKEYPQWYSWLIGGYLSGGPEKDILLSGIHITYGDCRMFKNIINSRKIAVNNLLEKFNKFENKPFELPLKKEEILKRVYSSGQKGGNKTNQLDINVEKAFQTLGYGFYSAMLLEKKINNILKSKITSAYNKPYKMIETNASLQPTISVGVGGKKKTNKTKRNNKGKHHKKTQRV